MSVVDLNGSLLPIKTKFSGRSQNGADVGFFTQTCYDAGQGESRGVKEIHRSESGPAK